MALRSLLESITSPVECTHRGALGVGSLGHVQVCAGELAEVGHLVVLGTAYLAETLAL